MKLNNGDHVILRGALYRIVRCVKKMPGFDAPGYLLKSLEYDNGEKYDVVVSKAILEADQVPWEKPSGGEWRRLARTHETVHGMWMKYHYDPTVYEPDPIRRMFRKLSPVLRVR